ncbi:putative hydro-lyase [Acuticoccus sp. I52.16.1]|uniref:putative hydro-lyase n=1 Tax=Acuticoccus sp. I52.16.1 TaxID=2928472 RepID=UPI001FD42F03|nr:putative hydro-lyase [Acuticoccus sp. I52.16.1]UOM34245.1 putative hydro-lyase [Acuticoccus sp. I52.16.1]
MNVVANEPLIEPHRLYFADPAALRRASRSGAFAEQTAGQCRGALQANLVILPKDAADEFLAFAAKNSKPCPLVGLSEPGSPHLPMVADDLDLRTDVPRYRVYRDGVCVAEPNDVTDLWRDDLVAFALGCSFSFEDALIAEGLPVRHVDAGRNVPMYVTGRPTEPAGRFQGPMVVSLRAMPPQAAVRAVVLSDRQPLAHGAPVHLGDPSALGIADVMKPDFGDPPVIEPGDMLVFWACGVTPQRALQAAKVPFAITHAPGYMLVTDLLAEGLTTFPTRASRRVPRSTP